MAEYIKKDEVTLEVTKPVEATEETNEYKLDFLKDQELSIIKQKDEFVNARNKELLEVREMIAKCTELGVKSELEVAKVNELEPTK